MLPSERPACFNPSAADGESGLLVCSTPVCCQHTGACCQLPPAEPHPSPLILQPAVSLPACTPHVPSHCLARSILKYSPRFYPRECINQCWLGVGRQSVEAADAVNALGICILFDLIGYTSDHRQDVLALRPAPIQVLSPLLSGRPGCPGIGSSSHPA